MDVIIGGNAVPWHGLQQGCRERSARENKTTADHSIHAALPNGLRQDVSSLVFLMEDQIKLTVSAPMHPSEVPQFLESIGFNQACDRYILDCWDKCTKNLSPEQLDEVREWWGPGWPAAFPRESMGLRKDFYDTVSEEAHHAILLLVHYGLG